MNFSAVAFSIQKSRRKKCFSGRALSAELSCVQFSSFLSFRMQKRNPKSHYQLLYWVGQCKTMWSVFFFVWRKWKCSPHSSHTQAQAIASEFLHLLYVKGWKNENGFDDKRESSLSHLTRHRIWLLGWIIKILKLFKFWYQWGATR